MDFLEDGARLAESETRETLKRRLREGYRRVVGCFPERRKEVRAALERIKAGALGNVADVLQADHVRGCS